MDIWDLLRPGGPTGSMTSRLEDRMVDALRHTPPARAPAALQNDVDELEQRVDRLTLLNAALWELLRDRAKLTEADLVNKVQEIDLRDGRSDGRIRSTPKVCDACGRTISSRHQRCLYCGGHTGSAAGIAAKPRH
ncbi:MAG: hypothetical protein IOD15_12205 [Phycisphaerales bacterium]|jgi:hypothetical protein|nr:hypothetical protein [Phycisphaerales bacterium]